MMFANPSNRFGWAPDLLMTRETPPPQHGMSCMQEEWEPLGLSWPSPQDR
jgi:hypothetical protein